MICSKLGRHNMLIPAQLIVAANFFLDFKIFHLARYRIWHAEISTYYFVYIRLKAISKTCGRDHSSDNIIPLRNLLYV